MEIFDTKSCNWSRLRRKQMWTPGQAFPSFRYYKAVLPGDQLQKSYPSKCNDASQMWLSVVRTVFFLDFFSRCNAILEQNLILLKLKKKAKS